jgi:hypothetical protein
MQLFVHDVGVVEHRGAEEEDSGNSSHKAEISGKARIGGKFLEDDQSSRRRMADDDDWETAWDSGVHPSLEVS